MYRFIKYNVILLLAIFFFISAIHVHAADIFQNIDLGSLGGGETYARSINSHGQVVGDSKTALGQVHAFIWENGVMKDLNENMTANIMVRTGSLNANGDYEIVHPLESHANAINEAGEVIGSMTYPNNYDPAYEGTQPMYAYLWKSGTVTNLTTSIMGGGGGHGFATDINNSSEILLNLVARRASRFHAFVWNADSGHTIETAQNEFSYGLSLDDAGTIKGKRALFAVNADTDTRPHNFISENGVLTELELTDDSIPVPPNTRTTKSSNGDYVVDNIYYKKIVSEATPSPTATLTPSPTPTSVLTFSGYKGEYFNNRLLNGPLALQRDDQEINFDWANGSPDPIIANDDFSVRWTKNIQTENSDYLFIVTADDGVRLWIDGNLVIDKWKDQSSMTYSAHTHLTNGSHLLKLEYYEHGGAATAKMSYEKVAGDTSDFTTEYFDNPTLSGTPKISTREAIINHTWGEIAPRDGIPKDNFSVRWTKKELFKSGTYKFDVTADDGVRLYIDNNLILDKWKDQPPTTYIVSTFLNDDYHTIKMEYYEHTAQATAILSYEKAQAYTANYWNISAFGSPPTIPVSQPDLSRTEDEIQNDWGKEAPANEIHNDNFIAQWRGNFQMEGSNYKFSTTSDDGMRVYIDGSLLLDKWNDHSSADYSFIKTLTSGTHDFRIEYYEKGGDAVAKFRYEKVDDTATTFKGEYFDNPSLSGTPKLIREDADIDFYWEGGSPGNAIPTDHFSARWTKRQTYTATGPHSFFIRSDDGVRFWIDNQLIVDDWTDHSPRTYAPTVNINAGVHNLKIEYLENGGNATMIFRQ